MFLNDLWCKQMYSVDFNCVSHLKVSTAVAKLCFFNIIRILTKFCARL